MKKFLHSYWGTYVILMLSIFSSLSSNAQYGTGGAPFSEAGISIGPSNFLGDLGGNIGKGTTFLKDNNFSMTKIMVGAHLTLYPRDFYGIRFAMNLGSIEGDDAVISGKGGLEEARKFRNQNFRSSIFEVMAVGELYPTVFFEEDATDVYHKIRPYGVLGVGVFHFNPKGLDPATGQWVELQPLHTEGQGFPEYPDRKEYKLWQLNIPMGIGVKYFVSENFSLSLEVLHRKTFTDYIDDVSTTYIDPQLFYNHLPLNQAALAERMADKTNAGGVGRTTVPGDKRGTATNNDGYYSFGFKLGFRLGGDGDRGSMRCPVIRF